MSAPNPREDASDDCDRNSPQSGVQRRMAEARLAHVADEKEFTHRRDALSRQRRELPWVRVEKNYVFEGPNGREALADLFAGRS